MKEVIILFSCAVWVVTFASGQKSQAACEKVKLVTREEWRSRPRVDLLPLYPPLNRVIIAHTETNASNCKNPVACMRTVKAIETYHTEDMGRRHVVAHQKPEAAVTGEGHSSEQGSATKSRDEIPQGSKDPNNVQPEEKLPQHAHPLDEEDSSQPESATKYKNHVSQGSEDPNYRQTEEHLSEHVDRSGEKHLSQQENETKSEWDKSHESEDPNDGPPKEGLLLQAHAGMKPANEVLLASKDPSHHHVDELSPQQDIHVKSANEQSWEREAAVCERPQLLPEAFKKQLSSGFNEGKQVQVTQNSFSLLEKGCGSESVKHQVEYFHTQEKELKADISRKGPVHTKHTAHSPSHQIFPSTSSVNTVKSVTPISCQKEFQRAAMAAIAKRPNFGTQGSRIHLISNYFILKGEGTYIYHYDVEINSESPTEERAKLKTIKEAKRSGDSQLAIQQKRNVGKEIYRKVISDLIQHRAFQETYPFYDGIRNLYTFKELPIATKCSISVPMRDGNKCKMYTVTIKPVNKNNSGNVINLESLTRACAGYDRDIPYDAIRTLETLLSHRNPPFTQIAIGRSFFKLSEAGKVHIDGQLEIWKGYNQSLHLTQRGPAVLVNASAKAFHSSGTVIDYTSDLLRFDVTRRRLGAQYIQSLSKSLRDVKVQVTHLSYPRKYTVASVTLKSAGEVIVNINNKDMSVAEYFAERYEPLKYPHLPCLSMKSSGKETYIPMECCIIPPGQPKLGQLNLKQHSQMIDKTAIPPSQRLHSITDYARTITGISACYLEQAGYKMELKPLNVSGRIISPPTLSYANEPPVKPDNRGVWHMEGKCFSEALTNSQWILISFVSQDVCPGGLLERLSASIVKASKHVGLHLSRPMAVRSFGRETNTYDALCFAKRMKVKFAFVILARNDTFHCYDEVKFIADIKLSLITQCMEVGVVRKCCEGPLGGQIMKNLLTKLNIKLGGTNHRFSEQLTIPLKKTIVMGADATHSPNKGYTCPSIAAVVGSIDDVPFQYAVSCRIQKNPDQSKLSQEIILGMKEMTKDILIKYRDRNSCFPERIIFFRDGVSEGQFEIALREELSLISEACYDVCKRILPTTFIVVQKRHQTRFVPRNPNDGIGRNRNIPPGTTVDTDVIHPVYFDYFLCSHEGMKGTSKPTHYVVLHDDNGFEADQLQKFCYDLCHVYARCNRSISIPAPAMNAHLAATRAKRYIEWCIAEDNRSGARSRDAKVSLLQRANEFINSVSSITAPMFFI